MLAVAYYSAWSLNWSLDFRVDILSSSLAAVRRTYDMRFAAGSVLACFLYISLGVSAPEQLTPSQKQGVCRLALSKTNANSASEYELVGTDGDVLSFSSARSHRYSCEIFGLVIKLSSSGWGRIQPTGNVLMANDCVKLRLYDPGLMISHEGEYCGK